MSSPSSSSSSTIPEHKRKRSNPSLPALTIVTRSSLRKQDTPSTTTKPKSARKQAPTHNGMTTKSRVTRSAKKQVNPKVTVPVTSSHSESEPESDQEEFEEEDAMPFKRLKLQEPMYLTNNDCLPSVATINNIHEDYDDEDDDEEMPKFQYESKFKRSASTSTKLYTPEERKIFNDMMFSEYLDLEEPSVNVMEYNEPEPALDFGSAEDLDTDLPLVTPVELEAEKPVAKVLTRKTSDDTRWPITQQDNSTSFSILGKETKVAAATAAAPKKEVAVSIKQEEPSKELEGLFEEESLDDFFMYDSASSTTEEDESDDNATSTSSPGPAEVEPLIWTSKRIPICGYRDRNQTIQLPTNGTLHPKRIMAALASLSAADNKQSPSSATESSSARTGKLPATAYYQQAVMAATGLNRRSLFSGKAREMIGGDAWA